eukprot:UN34004
MKYVNDTSKSIKPLHEDEFIKRLWFVGYRSQEENLKTKFPDYMKWYKQYGIDTLAKKKIPVGLEQAKKYAPQWAYGRDKQGHFVLYNCMNKYDFGQIDKHKDAILEAYIQMMVRLQDAARQASKDRGLKQYKVCCIVDMKDIGLWKATYNRAVIMLFIGVLQSRFPETLYRLFVVNGGAAFRGIWAMVKGWLDPVTQKKVVVLGEDYKDELLKVIDLEELDNMYGGTSKIKS